MSSNCVIYLTTGQPGSGKTYSRVRWLIKDFIPNNPTGYYISNFPLNVEQIAEYCFKTYNIPVEVTQKRFIFISDEDFNFWKSIRLMKKQQREKYMTPETYPPLQFISSLRESGKLNNAHIAIDEFHEIFGKGFSEEIRKLWGDYFSQIRKDGCTFECITQDLSKLANEYICLAGIRTELIQCSNLRDPIFKIMMYDWYQLRAGYLGINQERVLQTEYIKTTSFTGRIKWKEQKFDKFTLSEDWWKFYNSYTKTDGTKGNKKDPWEIHGKQTWKWFVRRNFWPLCSRAFAAIFLLWIFFGGGSAIFLREFMGFFASGCGLNKKPAIAAAASNPATSAPGAILSQSQLKTLEQQQKMYAAGPNAVEIAAFHPALFFDNQCWLKNSIRIKPDYKFKGGPHDGKTVKKIDSAERFYELDNGDRVYMFDELQSPH